MAVTAYSARSTLSNIYKKFYAPRIVKQYYNATPIMARLKRVGPDEIEFAGEQVVIPVHTGWSEGVGARGEGDDLPSPYYPKTNQMLADVAYNYGRIKITRPSMKASRNPGAWERALKFVMDDLRENMAWDGARQRIHGTGTGTLTQTNGAGAATTTLVVDSAWLLKENMVIDIYTAETGGSQEVNSVRISTVTPGSNTVTLAAASTWSDNSYVFREDSRNLEITGLAAAMDDGTRKASYQNITRSANAWLKANRLGNSGTNRALTIPLINQACVRAKQVGAGDEYPTAIYSNHALGLKYVDLISADRRYAGEKKTIAGGFEAIMHTHPGGQVPWILDGMMRPNEIWFPYEKDFVEAQLSSLEFVDDDGAVLNRVANKDEFEAYMAEYTQCVSFRCNRHTLLADISED